VTHADYVSFCVPRDTLKASRSLVRSLVPTGWLSNPSPYDVGANVRRNEARAVLDAALRIINSCLVVVVVVLEALPGNQQPVCVDKIIYFEYKNSQVSSK